jgi:N-acylglucosamine 2-epimerase
MPDWLHLYRKTLLEDVVPFWLRHGIDKQYGGIGNLLDDAGNVTGHDKYLWSQGRALWTFSALCNRIERRPEWLAFADHIFDYLRSHGRDEQGRWVFRLNKDGNVLDGDISIYVDGFVLAGMTEYYLATGSAAAKQLALETYENTRSRLAQPGSYRVAPYALAPGMKTHGIAMVFDLFYFELARALERPDIEQEALSHAHQVLNHFYREDRNAIVEFVTLDGRFVDSPEGRACVPGHAIESLWFLISIFERTGDTQSIQKCCALIKRHLELGWDPEFGGLMLALDIDGKEPPYWKHPTHKPWWVQVEALVATAFAHHHTRESWCMEWHRKVQEFAFSHYPVATGEWTQWVDREGQRMGNLALPVKDPFHLPRALIYLINLFQR